MILTNNYKRGGKKAIIKAFSGAIRGTFADQWKDILTAGQFDEHMVVAPGY